MAIAELNHGDKNPTLMLIKCDCYKTLTGGRMAGCLEIRGQLRLGLLRLDTSCLSVCGREPEAEEGKLWLAAETNQSKLQSI